MKLVLKIGSRDVSSVNSKYKSTDFLSDRQKIIATLLMNSVCYIKSVFVNPSNISPRLRHPTVVFISLHSGRSI